MFQLRENLSFDQAKMVVESANEGKDLYMKGICIQGGVNNANQRNYCLLYRSDASDELLLLVPGGRLMMKKKTYMSTVLT